jgi:hypothetical protein
MRSIERRRRHQQTKAIIGGCIISIFFVCVSFNQLNLDKKIGSATSLRLEVKETKNTTLVSPYDCQTPRNKDDSSSILDYNYLVNCTWLKDQLGLARFVLVVMLIVLLYLLSSTADAFFCPSLQAIVEKYRVPPDIAGVTFLSFGNGSPDVFSNIAAFSSSTPKIGVTSILGGGLLVTTVIAASVGLASQGQHQLIPRKYVRDIFFYFIGVCYFCYVFFDGLVSIYHTVISVVELILC